MNSHLYTHLLSLSTDLSTFGHEAESSVHSSLSFVLVQPRFLALTEESRQFNTSKSPLRVVLHT